MLAFRLLDGFCGRCFGADFFAADFPRACCLRAICLPFDAFPGALYAVRIAAPARGVDDRSGPRRRTCQSRCHACDVVLTAPGSGDARGGMTNQDRQNAALPRRETVAPARRPGGRPVAPRAPRAGSNPYLLAYRRLFARHQRLIRRVGIGGALVVGVLALGFVTLWWRLANGPIQLDVATPWLASAIEENFGSQHKVQVGGTQIERTGNGGAAVRIRDIVVRDAEGTVVASAPKAEVRVSGMSLLSGHMRAESLNLVGAELSVRIEQNGDVTVFAGANKHPLTTTPGPIAVPAPAPPAATTGHPALAGTAAAPQRKTSEIFAAL